VENSENGSVQINKEVEVQVEVPPDFSAEARQSSDRREEEKTSAEVVEPPQDQEFTGEVVELLPDRTKSEPVEEDNREEDHAAQQSTHSISVQPVQAATAVSTGMSGEQLYRDRVRASAKWLAGGYRDAYTVQLMMLASEQAEDNIKKLLVQDDYFAIRNNLYILRKKTSPPTLFVFYGTYDSMEQARQARNNMPLFLRKHHPYALSINDAMRKTED
jgi:septal ring-binding cell division protein DamX